MLRNVTLQERPIQTMTLVSAADAALRARRRAAADNGRQGRFAALAVEKFAPRTESGSNPAMMVPAIISATAPMIVRRNRLCSLVSDR
jgi:hypothetical protein